MHFQTFSFAIQDMANALKRAPKVHTERWQGFDISQRPEAAMFEQLFYNFSADLRQEDLEYYRQDIKPNIPWADDHFAERVSGQPLNPGEQWRKWPYALKADSSRDEHGQFNHTYMERYWPRWAGMTSDGILPSASLSTLSPLSTLAPYGHYGIRYRYGDLNDLIASLLAEPHTRQAYLPIFFPEDTGIANPGRKPCTLGYHFIMRDDHLHVTYYIRSCDFVRHLRDDIYLTIRLLLHILDQLRLKDPVWQKVKPGRYRMDIVSLHCFVNDRALL